LSIEYCFFYVASECHLCQVFQNTWQDVAGSIPEFGASISHLLSDQAMGLYFLKKSAKNGRFSVFGKTFQGKKHKKT